MVFDMVKLRWSSLTLIGQAALRNIGIEIFKLATIRDSDEISREAAHCLTFIGQKGSFY